MKILCIGHASYDITFPVEEFIKENTKNRVNEKVECGGGPASNAAYLLGKYGMETYFMGLVGNDFYGKKIKQELESVGVNTKYLLMNDDYSTTASTIIANKSNGSRTVLTYKSNTYKYPVTDIDFTPDIILVDGQEIEESNYIIDKYPNAITIIDAGRSTDEIINLSKKVNYVVCSKDFAEKCSNMIIDYDNKETLVEVYQKLEEIFDGTIVATLEAKGCLYKYNNFIKIMPSISVKAVDSTGAGDLFHGAFTYSVANNYSFEDTLKISNIVGALSVTKVGGRFSVPSKEEVAKYYEDFK